MYGDKTSGTALKSLHNGAKNILYCYVAAKYSRATAKGLDMGSLVDNKQGGVFAWWVPVLIIVNVLALIGAIDWAIRIFFPSLYAGKKNSHAIEQK